MFVKNAFIKDIPEKENKHVEIDSTYP